MNAFKFFAIERMSPIHAQIKNAEEAGSRILDAFEAIKLAKAPFTPIKIMAHDKFLAMSLLPIDAPNRMSISTMADGYRQQLVKAGIDFANPREVGVAAGGFVRVDGSVSLMPLDLLARLAVITHNLPALDSTPVPETIEADIRTVSGTWVMKVPYSEPVRGDNFVMFAPTNYTPPDARELSVAEMQDLTLGEAYENFGPVNLAPIEAKRQVNSLMRFDIEAKKLER